ncbi:phosphate system positive regulatory protein pho81, partial [Borealophlyctis nickersoniae]
MNYKGLKKIINSVDPAESSSTNYFTTLAASNPPGVGGGPGGGSTGGGGSGGGGGGLQDEPSPEFRALKTAFFFKLERELEKVNAFYLQKEAEFKVRLRTLVDKKRIVQNGNGRKQAQATLGNLREAFLQFQLDLTKLQNFVEWNATGFRKILKKWDKRAKSSTKELYLSRQIEIQPCFNNDVLAELQDQVTLNLGELEAVLSRGEEPEPIARLVELGEGGVGAARESMDDVETELTKSLSVGDVGSVMDFIKKRKTVGAAGAGGATAGAGSRVGTQSSSSAEDREFLSRAFLRFCAEGSLECLTLLLATDEVDCNFTDDVSNRTCLHEAAVVGRLDVMELCVKRGANIQALDVYGRQPLHYAAMYGQPDCALYLISAGAPVDALDHDGSTPLVYSIGGGHTKCAQILIENGAAVEPVSSTAPIPLSLACQHGHTDIVTLLLSKGAQLTPNADGLFPLHLSSREGHHEISQLLIDHGASVDAKDSFYGWTPVFFSASEGHLACVQVLLNAGCSISIKDEYDWIPWTHALYRGHIEVAKLLEVPNGMGGVGGMGGISMDLVVADGGIKPMAPSRLFVEDIATGDVNMDDIPDLSLPPPIIPFRIYGHAFLDKKCYIQITFPTTAHKQQSPIRLFGSRQLSSLKLIISSKPEVGIPFSVIVPLQEDSDTYTFVVADLSTFSLQFDIFPTFGTKPLGRAVVLPSQLDMAMTKSWSGAGVKEEMVCPLFDTHLRAIGELRFEFAVVRPFVHPSLTIGGKVETYWKSTKVVSTSKSQGEPSVQSFITASSLSEEYIQIVVQLTKDGIPAIYPSWFLPQKDSVGFNVGVSNVTFAQARKMVCRSRGIEEGEGAERLRRALKGGKGRGVQCEELAGVVGEGFFSLEEVLTTFPSNVGTSIVLKYPTASERAALHLSDLPPLNTFVNAVRQTVDDPAHPRSR